MSTYINTVIVDGCRVLGGRGILFGVGDEVLTRDSYCELPGRTRSRCSWRLKCKRLLLIVFTMTLAARGTSSKPGFPGLQSWVPAS